MVEQIQKYKAELDSDVSLDEINIKEVQLRLPGIKHKWVNRLILHKMQLRSLEREKRDIMSQLSTRLKAESVVAVSDATISRMIDNTDELVNLNRKIEDQKVFIEYLEKIEKILSSTTFDIKNAVELIKMETA